MKTIVLNNTNVTSNNTMVYSFPSGSARFENNQIAVSKISIYYSWPSITSGTNNGLSYTWVDGTTVTVDPPTGYYSVSDLNSYLQNVMVTNNHYLVDTTGNYVYYLELAENSVYYSVQFNAYPVPTALPAGWTNPGVWALPAVASTPQITVGSISSILGMTAGTYPSVVQATNYSYLSDFTPQVTPTQSVLVTCNLVNNPLAIPNNVIYCFSPNVGYGSLIQAEPNTPVWNDIQDGSYQQLVISLYDQSFQPLNVLDTNMVVLLEIS